MNGIGYSLQTKRLDYRAVRERILTGEISCIGLTKTFLKQIDEGKKFNAFISVLGDQAMQKAEEVDRKLSGGRAGRLAGMIVGVKDIIVMKSTRTTCGSKILETFISPYDATVIQRLEAEDAIIIGKTNLDEFGMGSSNENSAYGFVTNPYDSERIP